MATKPAWGGVFPAVTTQFRADFSVDLDATAKVIDALIRDGVSGLVMCGTVGENTALTRRSPPRWRRKPPRPASMA
jgi:1-pyrroline-4-hydroxy-2-carboxylate deaminase